VKTLVLRVSSDNPEELSISQAVKVLRAGGLVAFPTETVYGLGADAMNPKAVENVFQAKGRPSDNPLIVHVGEPSQVEKFARQVPELGRRLAEKFWPGPLTLVVPRHDAVSDKVTAGLDTVAIRMPDHPVALAMLRSFDGGVVAPSANLSGSPSPTTADHVFHDLEGRIDLILDGGSTRIGVESTVVDVTVDPPIILRQGGLTEEMIRETIGDIAITQSQDLLKRSPGTRYRHYAPKAKLVLVRKGDSTNLARLAEEFHADGQLIGVIAHTLKKPKMTNIGFWEEVNGDPAEFAKSLFGLLRDLDEKGVAVIVVEMLDESGIGRAVMDRLKKAAVQ
jgi:L-threonylcarbamoyladenylate synthase